MALSARSNFSSDIVFHIFDMNMADRHAPDLKPGGYSAESFEIVLARGVTCAVLSSCMVVVDNVSGSDRKVPVHLVGSPDPNALNEDDIGRRQSSLQLHPLHIEYCEAFARALAQRHCYHAYCPASRANRHTAGSACSQ